MGADNTFGEEYFNPDMERNHEIPDENFFEPFEGGTEEIVSLWGTCGVWFAIMLIVMFIGFLIWILS